MRKVLAVTIVMILLSAMVIPTSAQDEDTLYDVIAGNAELSTFKTVIDAAGPGVIETLSDEDVMLTLFAPSNDAFETAFSEMGLDAEALLADPLALTIILSHHTVPMFLTSDTLSELDDETYLGTLLPNWPLVYFSDGIGSGEYFGEFVETDIIAENGAIHVISSVLPPEVELMRDYYQELNGYDDTLMKILFDTANGDAPEYSVLTELVTANEDDFIYNFLDAVIDVGSAYTIFAPTDEGFNNLFSDMEFSVEEALEDPEGTTFVLGYHILPGTYAAEYILCGEDCHGDDNSFSAITLAGIPITFTFDGDTVVINGGTTVLSADLFGYNGVIHTIDGVLLP